MQRAPRLHNQVVPEGAGCEQQLSRRGRLPHRRGEAEGEMKSESDPEENYRRYCIKNAFRLSFFFLVFLGA